MTTKIKKQSKAKEKNSSPTNAKSSLGRRTIENRDLNEDEQQQVTNSTREREEASVSDHGQTSNLDSHEDHVDGPANGDRERRDQMQEDDKKHATKGRV